MSKTNGSLLRRVLRLVRPYRFFIAASLLGAAISVAAQLLVPILCGDAIDAMIGMGRVDFALVAKACLAIAVSTAITAVAQWVLAACNNRIAFRVSQDLRTAAMAKIQRLPLSYLDSHPSGDLVSRIIADVDTFSDGLLMGFTQFFSGVLTIAGTLILMAVIHLGVTAVVVVLTPLSLFAAGFITRRTYRYFKTQSAIRGEQTALVEEMIQGQRVVQAFGYEEKSQEAFDEVNERLKTASIQAVFFSSLTNPVTRFVNSVVYAAVGLTGALLAMGSGISVGQLSVFLSYANQYAKPFNEISGVVTELQNAMACIQRIFDLLDEPDQIPDAPDAVQLVSDGQVAIRDVAFSYTPDRPLLQNLSLDVRPGQRIAIVGPTGCGKTTLINLLMRFYDVDSGSISVAGHDIRTVTRSSLRRNYGMVLQDTWLRAGTIRENIAYGRPEASDAEIVAAAKAAHAHQLHPPPAPGLRHGDCRGRRKPEPGAEAAPLHRPGDAVPAAHAHSRRGHLLHRHPHRGKNPGGLRKDDGGAHQLHRRPSPVHHPGGRCDFGHARRQDHRAGQPPEPAFAKGLLCHALL